MMLQRWFLVLLVGLGLVLLPGLSFAETNIRLLPSAEGYMPGGTVEVIVALEHLGSTDIDTIHAIDHLVTYDADVVGSPVVTEYHSGDGWGNESWSFEMVDAVENIYGLRVQKSSTTLGYGVIDGLLPLYKLSFPVIATGGETLSFSIASSSVNIDDVGDEQQQDLTSLPEEVTVEEATSSLAIGDMVFQDNDGSGGITIGDQGLANVTLLLYADDHSPGVFDTDDSFLALNVSSFSGTYSFQNLSPGDYFVAVDAASVPAGYSRTLPSGSDVYSVPLTVSSDANADFGYEPAATPTPTVTATPTNTATTTATATTTRTPYSTEGFFVIDLTTALAAVAAADGSSVEPGGIAQLGTQDVVVLDDDLVLLAAELDFSTTDLLWSSVTGESDGSVYRSFVDMTDAEGLVDDFTLYVPAGESSFVGICPHATMISEVTNACLDLYYLDENSANVERILRDGTWYWAVSGFTEMGGGFAPQVDPTPTPYDGSGSGSGSSGSTTSTINVNVNPQVTNNTTNSNTNDVTQNPTIENNPTNTNTNDSTNTNTNDSTNTNTSDNNNASDSHATNDNASSPNITINMPPASAGQTGQATTGTQPSISGQGVATQPAGMISYPGQMPIAIYPMPMLYPFACDPNTPSCQAYLQALGMATGGAATPIPTSQQMQGQSVTQEENYQIPPTGRPSGPGEPQKTAKTIAGTMSQGGTLSDDISTTQLARPFVEEVTGISFTGKLLFNILLMLLSFATTMLLRYVVYRKQLPTEHAQATTLGLWGLNLLITLNGFFIFFINHEMLYLFTLIYLMVSSLYASYVALSFFVNMRKLWKRYVVPILTRE